LLQVKHLKERKKSLQKKSAESAPQSSVVPGILINKKKYFIFEKKFEKRANREILKSFQKQ